MSSPTSFSECNSLEALNNFVDSSEGKEPTFSFLAGRRVTIGRENISLSAIVKKTESLCGTLDLNSSKELTAKLAGRVLEFDSKIKGAIDKFNPIKWFFANVSLFFSNLFYNTTKHAERFDTELTCLLRQLSEAEADAKGEDCNELGDKIEEKVAACVANREFATLGLTLSQIADDDGDAFYHLFDGIVMALKEEGTGEAGMSALLNFLLSIKSFPKGMDFKDLMSGIFDDVLYEMADSETIGSSLRKEEKIMKDLEPILARIVNKDLFVAMMLEVARCMKQSEDGIFSGRLALDIVTSLVDMGKSLPKGVSRDELILDVMGKCFCERSRVDLWTAFHDLLGKEKSMMAKAIGQYIRKEIEDDMKELGRNINMSDYDLSGCLEYDITIKPGEGGDELSNEDVFLLLDNLKETKYMRTLFLPTIIKDAYISKFVDFYRSCPCLMVKKLGLDGGPPESNKEILSSLIQQRIIPDKQNEIDKSIANAAIDAYGKK